MSFSTFVVPDVCAPESCYHAWVYNQIKETNPSVWNHRKLGAVIRCLKKMANADLFIAAEPGIKAKATRKKRVITRKKKGRVIAKKKEKKRILNALATVHTLSKKSDFRAKCKDGTVLRHLKIQLEENEDSKALRQVQLVLRKTCSDIAALQIQKVTRGRLARLKLKERRYAQKLNAAITSESLEIVETVETELESLRMRLTEIELEEQCPIPTTFERDLQRLRDQFEQPGEMIRIESAVDVAIREYDEHIDVCVAIERLRVRKLVGEALVGGDAVDLSPFEECEKAVRSLRLDADVFRAQALESLKKKDAEAVWPLIHAKNDQVNEDEKHLLQQIFAELEPMYEEIEYAIRGARALEEWTSDKMRSFIRFEISQEEISICLQEAATSLRVAGAETVEEAIRAHIESDPWTLTSAELGTLDGHAEQLRSSITGASKLEHSRDHLHVLSELLASDTEIAKLLEMRAAPISALSQEFSDLLDERAETAFKLGRIMATRQAKSTVDLGFVTDLFSFVLRPFTGILFDEGRVADDEELEKAIQEAKIGAVAELRFTIAGLSGIRTRSGFKNTLKFLRSRREHGIVVKVEQEAALNELKERLPWYSDGRWSPEAAARLQMAFLSTQALGHVAQFGLNYVRAQELANHHAREQNSIERALKAYGDSERKHQSVKRARVKARAEKAMQSSTSDEIDEPIRASEQERWRQAKTRARTKSKLSEAALGSTDATVDKAIRASEQERWRQAKTRARVRSKLSEAARGGTDASVDKAIRASQNEQRRQAETRARARSKLSEAVRGSTDASVDKAIRASQNEQRRQAEEAANAIRTTQEFEKNVIVPVEMQKRAQHIPIVACADLTWFSIGTGQAQLVEGVADVNTVSVGGQCQSAAPPVGDVGGGFIDTVLRQVWNGQQLTDVGRNMVGFLQTDHRHGYDYFFKNYISKQTEATSLTQADWNGMSIVQKEPFVRRFLQNNPTVADISLVQTPEGNVVLNRGKALGVYTGEFDPTSVRPFGASGFRGEFVQDSSFEREPKILGGGIKYQ